MSTYNSVRQYEPITIPSEASPSERRAWQRLTEILDDIYLKYGRLSINDLAKTTVQAINKAGVFESVQVKDLQATLARFATAEIGSATITSAQIGTLSAQLVNALRADLERAEIEEAEIENLTAQALEAITAKMESCVAGTITASQMYADIFEATSGIVGDLRTQNFTSAIANISYAQIANLVANTADIDFARIKDLVANKAVITKGTSGKLYITELAVTDANMLSLTVGQLVVKGADGRYYQLVVDPESEDGFSLREVEMDGDQLADNTVAGGKIIENSITARELNVETIFADEAIIREILAGYGQFGDLEAINGFIGKLETQLIQSSGLKVLVKDDIDSLRTEVNQRTDGLEARVEANENGISTLQTGVTVDATGVTIRQPNQTDNTMVLRAGSMTINAPGREALVISQEETYLPSLRMTQLVLGNLVTTVIGSGLDCRVVSQYVQ